MLPKLSIQRIKPSYHLFSSGLGFCQVSEDEIMNKDRVIGALKEVRGAVRQVVGKAARLTF